MPRYDFRESRWTGRAIGALCSASLHLAIVWLAVTYAPDTGNHEPVRVYLSAEKVHDHLWQSTLFATAIGLLTIAVRRNRAGVSYALWLAASLKFLVPLPLIVWIARHLAPPAALRDLAPDSLVSFVFDIQQPLVVPLTFAISPAASLGELTTPMDNWPGVVLLALLVIWAWGLLTVAAMRFQQWRRLERIIEAGTPLELPGVPLPIDVRSIAGLIEPGVVGWRRPVLLMPAGIEQHLAAPEIEAIVLHELCHVRRRDNLTASVHMIVEAIFWFHPMVWWIGSRLIDERERACDEHVLRVVARPSDYARAILNVCKQYVASPLACVSGVSSANVQKRIDAILANRIGEAIGPWKTSMLGACVTLLVIVPVGTGTAARSPRLSSAASTAARLSPSSGPVVLRTHTEITVTSTMK